MAGRALELDVEYGGRSLTWRELGELINKLTEEQKDRHALVCSDPPSDENPYTILALMSNHGDWGPMLIQEY